MLNLNLLVLRCRELEKSKRFFECFRLRFEKHAHGKGPQHFASENADGVLELYPALEVVEDVRDATGLGFSSSDLVAVSDLLRSNGFDPQPPREQPWGRTFVVRDPDGRRVKIKEIPSAEADPTKKDLKS